MLKQNLFAHEIKITELWYETLLILEIMAHRHDRHKDLTGEHKLGDAGQLILAVLFFTSWILDSFFLNLTTSLNEYVPNIIRLPVGFVFLIISAYLVLKGLKIVFGTERSEPCVIREGVFGWVRHPVYLSELLLYFGLLILSTSLIAAFIFLVAVFFLHYISRHEEKLLLKRFGEDYELYMKEVPMWIPRLISRNK